jgi:arylsulfatase A-like enzyme
MAEDMSARVGSFGDPVAVTPRLDQLAEQGVRFDNVFTTAGVCAPSRAAAIMGAHQIAWGGQHMRPSAAAYNTVPPANMKAFPELLRAAGYYTYNTHKLDYQFSGVFAGSGPFTIWDDDSTGAHWRNAPPNKPFFGYMNFLVTHESGLFEPLGGWPHSGTHFLMQVMRARQFGIRGIDQQVSPDAVRLEPYYPDIPSVRRAVARHYNNIAAMDAEVGELLDQLRSDGLAENTVVIWTTDHGDGLPRAKRDLFDSGIRVPMIVRWPERFRPAGVAPGTLDMRMISFVDLAPTILGLAGVDVPDYMHGRGFADPGTPRRENVYASRDRIDSVQDRQRAVRNRRFKYIRSYQPEQESGHPLAYRDNLEMVREMRALFEADQLDEAQSRWFEAPGAEQLFDLRADPYELSNLAADPEMSPVLGAMRGELDRWLAEVGDTSEEPEAMMAERFWPGGEQPVTREPSGSVSAGFLTLESVDVGASLGYRINSGAWQLYSGPVTVAPGDRITAKAVRYGWAESATVDLIAPRQ